MCKPTNKLIKFLLFTIQQLTNWKLIPLLLFLPLLIRKYKQKICFLLKVGKFICNDGTEDIIWWKKCFALFLLNLASTTFELLKLHSWKIDVFFTLSKNYQFLPKFPKFNCDVMAKDNIQSKNILHHVFWNQRKSFKKLYSSLFNTY